MIKSPKKGQTYFHQTKGDVVVLGRSRHGSYAKKLGLSKGEVMVHRQDSSPSDYFVVSKKYLHKI